MSINGLGQKEKDAVFQSEEGEMGCCRVRDINVEDCGV